MKKLTVVFLTDPGHGWLKVRRDVLAKLGLLHQISGYSYERNRHVYLEEDCDAPKLLEALKAAGVTLRIKNKNSNKQSKVRSYAHFRHVEPVAQSQSQVISAS